MKSIIEPKALVLYPEMIHGSFRCKVPYSKREGGECPPSLLSGACAGQSFPHTVALKLQCLDAVIFKKRPTFAKSDRYCSGRTKRGGAAGAKSASPTHSKIVKVAGG